MRRPFPLNLRFGLGLLALGALSACDTAAPGLAAPDAPALARSASAPTVFNVQLRPEEEVRTTTADPVDSDARGHIQFKLYADNTLAWKVTIHNPAGETFVAGHIHRGAAGTNGPVVVGLFESGPASDLHLRLAGSAVIASALADAIRSNPAGFYVNYHTTADPQGAIRGQMP